MNTLFLCQSFLQFRVVRLCCLGLTFIITMSYVFWYVCCGNIQYFSNCYIKGNVMNNTCINTAIPHLFSSISALFSAGSKSYIVRFNVHETFQINQSDFLISNSTLHESYPIEQNQKER